MTEVNLKSLNAFYDYGDSNYNTWWDANGNSMTNLAYGQWLIFVYGPIANRGTGTTTLYGAVLSNTNSLSTTIATKPNVTINWPDGNGIMHVPFLVTLNSTTCPTREVWGFTDQSAALRMTGYRLDTLES